MGASGSARSAASRELLRRESRADELPHDSAQERIIYQVLLAESHPAAVTAYPLMNYMPQLVPAWSPPHPNASFSR